MTHNVTICNILVVRVERIPGAALRPDGPDPPDPSIAQPIDHQPSASKPETPRRLGSSPAIATGWLPQRGFDDLTAVLFNLDFPVMPGVILTHEQIEPNARRNGHVNTW
jgi:hypothetical protein